MDKAIYCKENCTSISFWHFSIYYDGYRDLVIEKANTEAGAWQELINAVFENGQILDWEDTYFDEKENSSDPNWEIVLQFGENGQKKNVGYFVYPRGFKKVDQAVAKFMMTPEQIDKKVAEVRALLMQKVEYVIVKDDVFFLQPDGWYYHLINIFNHIVPEYAESKELLLEGVMGEDGDFYDPELPAEELAEIIAKEA